MPGLRASVAPGHDEKARNHMKVIDTPSTNKIGTKVAYVSPYGQCYRIHVVPDDPRTDIQLRQRGSFGDSSSRWSGSLTDLQRQHWDTAALQTPSHPSLRQYYHLSGQLLWIKIDSTLRFLGQPPVVEPPAPVVFGPNPVTSLLIDYATPSEIRLRLSVGPLTEDIMVFGQAPCNSGRRKLRRVYFLGLAGPATDGQCDITAPYTGRFGKPAPGKRVFIVTSQHRNGWRGPDSVVSALVPPPPAAGEPPTGLASGPEAASVSAAPGAGHATV